MGSAADDQKEYVHEVLECLMVIADDVGDLDDWWMVLDCLAMCRLALTRPKCEQPTPETQAWFDDLDANADVGEVTVEMLQDALTLSDLRLVPSNDEEAGQAYVEAIMAALPSE